MEFFKANDGCQIAYQDVGDKSQPLLILVSIPSYDRHIQEF